MTKASLKTSSQIARVTNINKFISVRYEGYQEKSVNGIKVLLEQFHFRAFFGKLGDLE